MTGLTGHLYLGVGRLGSARGTEIIAEGAGMRLFIDLMERVTGIGGIFFKADDPEKLRAWYAKHLQIPVEDWGGASFKWREKEDPKREG